MARAEGVPRSFRTAFQSALLVGAPLLIGGVHPPVILALSWLSLLFLGVIVYHNRLTERRMEVPRIGWAMLGLALFTGLQLIPLPLSVLHVIAQPTAELYEFVLRDLPTVRSMSWRPITLNPEATALELLKLAGLTALVVASANTHRKPGSRETIAFVLAATGGLIAVLALSGLALETTDFLGIYKPNTSWDPQVAHGPFVNPNHLAGFLGLAAFAAYGYATVSHQQRGKGAFSATLGALCLGGLILSGSRGGLAAFVLTLPLFALLWWRARRGGSVALAPLAATLVLILGGALLYPELSRTYQLHSDSPALQDDQKVQAWVAMVDQVQDNPWVGTGRGAFAQAHTRYKVLPLNLRFTHAENQPLQLLADWGIPVGAAALAVFLLLMLKLLRRPDLHAVDAGMLSGLIFLGLQNLVDFNLEFLGVGVPAAIVLGLLVRPSARTPTRISPPPASNRHGATGPGAIGAFRAFWRHSRPQIRLLLASTLVLATLGTSAHLLNKKSIQFEELRQSSRKGPVQPELLHEVLEDQPAEYLVPLWAARALFRGTQPRTEIEPSTIARLLNQATFLNPTAPGPHLLTARLLWATDHRSQALAAYRKAVNYGAPLSHVVPELLRHELSSDELLLALPTRPEVLRVLAGSLLERQRWQAAERVFSLLLQYPESRVNAASQRALIALETGSPMLALRRARELMELAPHEGGSHQLLGRALLRNGQVKEAQVAFQRAVELDPRLDRAWHELLTELAREGDWDAVARTLERFKPYSPRTGRATATYHAWRGRLLLQDRNLGQAILAYEQAAAAEPQVISHQLMLASLKEQVGDLAGALAVLRHAHQQGAQPKVEEALRQFRLRNPGPDEPPPELPATPSP